MVKLEEVDVDPLGFVSTSSFAQKWGTPRQGALVPTATAVVTLNRPQARLSGRVAVVWAAHLNSPSFNHLKAHIKPPKKLDGPVGVFATRGVHRPSSVGLTFCEVIEQDEGSLTLRGADMIRGTPILGLIQVPPPPEGMSNCFRIPAWTKVSETRINWSFASFFTVTQICDGEASKELLNLVRSVLQQDPRSQHSMKKHVSPIYEVELTVSSGQSFWLVYSHGAHDSVDVLFITRDRLVSEHRSRTEPWLSRLVLKMPQLTKDSPS